MGLFLLIIVLWRVVHLRFYPYLRAEQRAVPLPDLGVTFGGTLGTQSPASILDRSAPLATLALGRKGLCWCLPPYPSVHGGRGAVQPRQLGEQGILLESRPNWPQAALVCPGNAWLHLPGILPLSVAQVQA